MNENEMNIQQETPVTEETAVVETAATEEKTGLTGGQKAAGLGILALALYGLYKLIRGAITGVKSLFQKGKKKLQDHKAAKEAQEQDINPDDIIEAEELEPEEK